MIFLKNIIIRPIRFFSVSFSFRNVKKMEYIYLRNVEPSERFDVTFTYADSLLNIKRQFNLSRKVEENINDFLSRLKTNLEKVVMNKAKRKKNKESADVEELAIFVKVLADDVEVEDSLTCKEVFFTGKKNLKLKINGSCYDVLVNPPWVESISMPHNLMSGFFAYPRKLEILFASKADSSFIWSKSDESGGNWKEVSRDFRLCLSDDFVGCKLKLTCIPSDGKIEGPQVSCESNSVIKAGPKDLPLVSRQLLTSQPTALGSLRVVSYNILADVYAETEAAKTELFPYCPPFARDIDYRKQLYIRELIGYNADIICLQECDVRIFKNDLINVLEDHEGVMTAKSGTVAEGIATFYAKRKFRLIETKELIFGEEIDKNPLFSEIWKNIENNEPVKNNVKERSTVFHALVLESTEEDRTIVVGNTHLYFHPKADHIRLIQGGMAVLFMTNIINNLKQNGKKGLLIFCGDMNSTPDCGLYLLMTEKMAPANLPDWHSDEEEPIRPGIELRQPLEMRSAYGTPPFTNFTGGFVGCLDYIYYQADQLQLKQVVPIPEENVLKQHTALPSPHFPSDHVALVADFSFI